MTETTTIGIMPSAVVQVNLQKETPSMPIAILSRLKEIIGMKRTATSCQSDRCWVHSSIRSSRSPGAIRNTSGPAKRATPYPVQELITMLPQVMAMPPHVPNTRPFAIAKSSSGNGTKEWTTMSAVEVSGAQGPRP